MSDGTSIPAASLWLELISHQKSFAFLFAAAAICTFIGTPLFIQVARRRGWIDRPGGRKDHLQATPTMGGLVIFVAVYAGAAITLAWPNRVGEMLREHMQYVIGALACTAVAIGLGVLDDRRGVRPKIKLLVQVAIATVAYFIGFRIAEVTLPGLGSAKLGGVSFLLTLFWIIGIINAVNFTDGLDGLAAGVCFLAAAVNAGVAVWLGNYYMAVMMLLLAGALLGFLRWNFHPARVFLGDTGSLGLGTFLALCSLHSVQKGHTAVMILAPLCALGYPIFDMLLAVARRTLRGQPVWTSDRDHIHHRLVARGHTPSQAAAIIYGVSMLLVIGGVLAMSANHLAIGLAVAALLALAVFILRVLGYIEWGGWREREETKVLHAAGTLAGLKLRTAATLDDVLSAFAVVAAETGCSGVVIMNGTEQLEWRPREPAVAAEQSQRSALGRLELSAGRNTVIFEGPVESLQDPEVRALLDNLCRQAAALLHISKKS